MYLGGLKWEVLFVSFAELKVQLLLGVIVIEALIKNMSIFK